MIEFDDWMEKKCSVIQSAYGEEYTAAQEAWDFQQAKIDELQARVDEALKQLDLAYPESWGCCVDEAINILKGNKDD